MWQHIPSIPSPHSHYGKTALGDREKPPFDTPYNRCLSPILGPYSCYSLVPFVPVPLYTIASTGVKHYGEVQGELPKVQDAIQRQ